MLRRGYGSLLQHTQIVERLLRPNGISVPIVILVHRIIGLAAVAVEVGGAFRVPLTVELDQHQNVSLGGGAPNHKRSCVRGDGAGPCR